MYSIADDVLECAKWHKEHHHSRQTIVDCLFYGLYESKHKESIPLALIWADNKSIDAELAKQAEELADNLYEGGI
jgi:hypothetical protein